MMTLLHNHFNAMRAAFLATAAILSTAYPCNGYKSPCPATSLCFGHSNAQDNEGYRQSATLETSNINRAGFTVGSVPDKVTAETVQALLMQNFDSTTNPGSEQERNRYSVDQFDPSDYNNVTQRFNRTGLDNGSANGSDGIRKNLIGIEKLFKTTVSRMNFERTEKKEDDQKRATVSYNSEDFARWRLYKDLDRWRLFNITDAGNDSSSSKDEASTDQITFQFNTEEASDHNASIVTTLAMGSNQSNAGLLPLSFYWQRRVADLLFAYVSPFLLGIGTVGNAMSIVALQHSLFKSSSTAFILSALSFADIAALNVGLMHKWLRSAFNIEIRTMSTFGCQLHFMLTYYTHQLSSWMVVLLTAERTISVCMPLRCKEICSKRRVVIAWLAINFLTFWENIYFFFAFNIKFYQNAPTSSWFANQAVFECEVRRDWVYFWANVWVYLFPFLADWFPFVIILAGNIVTIGIIIKSHRSRRSQMGVSSNSEVDKRMASTSIMLLGVSVMFIVLNVPREVAYVIRNGPILYGEQTAISNFLYAVVNIITYINNAFGFLVYFASGGRFRRAFVYTFCPCRRLRIKSLHSLSN